MSAFDNLDVSEAEDIADRVELRAAGIREEEIEDALANKDGGKVKKNDEEFVDLDEGDIKEQFLTYTQANGEGQGFDGSLSVEALIAGLRKDVPELCDNMNDSEILFVFNKAEIDIVDNHIDYSNFKKLINVIINGDSDEEDEEYEENDED